MAYETGAVDYLINPYDPRILQLKASVLVDLWRQRELIKRQAERLRRHEREELERRSEHRFRSLVDAMPLCVWTARADGRFQYANEAAVAYTGGAAVDIGAALAQSVHADDQWRVVEAWLTELAERRPLELQMRLRRHADGAYRWHIARAVPQREEDGRFAGWLVTAVDIDEQKRAEAAEREAREEAERTNASIMKNELLTTLSHELRTPLTVIAWNAEILRRGRLSREHAEHAVGRIVRNAAAQERIVDNILDVSRIATGRLEIQLTPAGGRVTVQSRHTRTRLEITVTDTGEGIDAAFLPRLFDSFTKADRAKNHEREGLGLGLAVARKLAELHGGSIRAESLGKGLGATFTIQLPHTCQHGAPRLRALAHARTAHAAREPARRSAHRSSPARRRRSS